MNIDELLKISNLSMIDKKSQLSWWAISKISGFGYGEINKIYQNSNVFRKINKFSNIFKTIRVSIVMDNKIFKFPITPNKIVINGNDLILEEFDTIKGKINRINDISLLKINFSSFFPAKYYNFSNDYSNFGVNCVNEINNIKNKRKKCKLIIAGLGLVLDCYISKFSYETSPEDDIYYTIEFTQEKSPNIYDDNSYNYIFKPKMVDFSK